MSEEIEYLREYLRGIIQYKGLQEELTYDVPLQMLKRICIALDYLQLENQQLKKEIIGKKSSIKALKIALKERTEERDNHYDKEHLYKSVIDEVKQYILDKCLHSFLFRNEHIEKIFEMLANIKENQVVENNTMVSVGARNFKCECGANVFTEYEDNIFKCHGCGNEYKGE